MSVDNSDSTLKQFHLEYDFQFVEIEKINRWWVFNKNAIHENKKKTALFLCDKKYARFFLLEENRISFIIREIAMYRSMCRTNRLSAVWRRLQVWRDKALHFICSTWSRHYLFSVLFYFTIMHLLIDSSTQNNIYKALKLNTTKEKNNVCTSIVTWIELIRATSRSYVVQHTRGMLFDSDGLDLSQRFIRKKENGIRKLN